MSGTGGHFSCPVCAGPLLSRHTLVAAPDSSQSFAVLGCAACGHGVTITPEPARSTAHGGNYGMNRHAFTDGWCARRRARWVQRFTHTGAPRRVLDIGCGDGAFLRVIQCAGWQVAGTECAQRAAALEQLNVGTSLDDAAAHAPFGAITLWHSLEHLDDPVGLLCECRALLHPAGALFVAVPDARSLAARTFGRHWLHLDVPRHRHHFSPTSLLQTLRAAGFTARDTLGPEFEYEWLGWSQSALDAAGLPQRAFFDALRGAPRGGGAAARLLHLAVGSAASMLMLLPAAYSALAPSRCHLVCTAGDDAAPRAP